MHLSKLDSLLCTVVQTRSSSFRRITIPESENRRLSGRSHRLVGGVRLFSFIEEVVSSDPKIYAFSVF